MYARDGYDYDGYRLRVEFPKGGGGSFRGARGGSGGGRGGRGPPARRSQYRVIVSGLPPTGSWQDLKDHMREAGDVCFSDVYKDGTGAVEYLRYEDMKYALKKLDDTKFRSHEVSVVHVYQTLLLPCYSGRDCVCSRKGRLWRWGKFIQEIPIQVKVTLKITTKIKRVSYVFPSEKRQIIQSL